MSLRFVFLLALPAAIDSIVRAVLFARSRHGLPLHPSERVARWLVLVPSRAEGENLRITLSSIRHAMKTEEGEIVVLLDGEDAVGEQIVREHDCVAIVKMPPGPSKAAALRWFGHHHRDRLRVCDAVLLLDVGSRLPEEFFECFRWPRHTDAVQAFLRGEGSHVGEAVSFSENTAQTREDVGRERMGWCVRLRGTGMAILPSVFERLVMRLVTQVEDLEASLLLMADGCTCRMTPGECFVLDEKPESVSSAAVQRARWLAGKLEIIFRQLPAIGRGLWRRPLESLAFIAELFGRPIALSVPFRVVIAFILLISGLRQSDLYSQGLGVFLIGTCFSDCLLVLRRAPAGTLWRMAAVWLGAVVLAPSAFVRWMRARRS